MKKFTLKFGVITMKKIWFILMVLSLTAANFGLVLADDSVATEPGDAEPVDRIGIAGPLVFNETVFNLAWTAHPDETYYAQEYLPEGENVETFDQMLAVHVFLRDISPKDAVEQKAKELKKRGKKDPVCKYAIWNSPDKMEFIIDFMVGESENNISTLVEFDIYRYRQIHLDNGKKALMILMYCKRGYRPNIRPFFKWLANTRMGLTDEMTMMEIPVATIAE